MPKSLEEPRQAQDSVALQQLRNDLRLRIIAVAVLFVALALAVSGSDLGLWFAVLLWVFAGGSLVINWLERRNS